jgi:hypothetical protein
MISFSFFVIAYHVNNSVDRFIIVKKIWVASAYGFSLKLRAFPRKERISVPICLFSTATVRREL